MLMEGVMKLVPLPRALPPLATSNQLIVPALAVAPKVTVPAPHRPEGEVAVIVGDTLAVAKTAVLADVQVPLVTST